MIKYCEILKEKSLFICESKGNPNNIKDFMPLIDSIMWATKPLNLSCLQEFSGMMMMFFN